MHAGAGLGDDTVFAHAPGQQDLAKHIIHLVRAGVIKLLALEIDLGAAAMPREALGEIEWRRAAHIMGQIAVHLPLESGIGLGRGVGFFQFKHERHQRLGDKASTVDAEMAVLVGTGAEGIELLHCHWTDFLRRRVNVLRSRASRRTHKGNDLIDVFHSGSALDTGRNVDPLCTGDPQRVADIAGIKPAGQHKRHAGLHVLEQMPIESVAEAAWAGSVARRVRIKQQPIDHRSVGADALKIVLNGNRHSLHHRQAELAPDRRNLRHGFRAVQLQYVRMQSLDNRLQKRLIGIHRQGYFLRAATHPLAESARDIELQMPRRGRKEHESDHVGAGIERGVQRLWRRQPANFDDERHLPRILPYPAEG